jgi:hypothetical protein
MISHASDSSEYFCQTFSGAPKDIQQSTIFLNHINDGSIYIGTHIQGGVDMPNEVRLPMTFQHCCCFMDNMNALSISLILNEVRKLGRHCYVRIVEYYNTISMIF